jgi:LPS export ABC transporter protein LptC
VRTARQQLQTIRRLRRGILAALVLVVVAVAGLYLFGRAGRDAGEPEHATAGAAGATGEGVTLAGEGFDYTLTQGEQPIFRIRGARIRSDREENVELEKVGLTLFRADGSRYELEGRFAEYNRTTHDARLRGGVRLAGPHELELRTTELQLDRGGRRLSSHTPVEFRFAGAYVGKAGKLSANLRQNNFLLVEGVKVETLPGVEPAGSLETDRVVLERDEGTLRADGGATVRRGADRLAAKRLVAQLSADERAVESVRARGEVQGELHGADEQAAVTHIRSEAISLGLAGAGGAPEKVEVEGSKAQPVRLEVRAADGAARTIVAPFLTAELQGGALRAAHALGGVVFEEPAADGTRRATAQEAEAAFAAGELSGIVLRGGVRLQTADLRAAGNRANVDVPGGRFELFGKPATVFGERGDLRAPHLVYTRDTRLVHADGGVEARLEREAAGELAAATLGGGEGPVQVEAGEAFWREKPQSFVFRERVRAWRGSSLLLADQLRGDEEQDQLAATGHVKTVWVPKGKEGAAPSPASGTVPTAASGAASTAASGAAPAAADPARRAPIEVTAESLLYRRGERYLLYTGQVRVVQERRALACAETRVDLDEDDEARLMTCSGGAVIDDPAAGRRVTGERAVYDVAAGVVTVTGAPVVLVDQVRGRAEGRRLVYDLAKGTATLRAEAEAPAPGAAP